MLIKNVAFPLKMKAKEMMQKKLIQCKNLFLECDRIPTVNKGTNFCGVNLLIQRAFF